MLHRGATSLFSALFTVHLQRFSCQVKLCILLGNVVGGIECPRFCAMDDLSVAFEKVAAWIAILLL